MAHRPTGIAKPVFRPFPGAPLLALPEDERWITDLLVDEFGLQLVHAGPGGNEVGEPIDNPLEWLSPELPSAREQKRYIVPGLGTRPEYSEIWKLAFWDPTLGSIQVQTQPPPPLYHRYPDWQLKRLVVYPAPLLELDRSYWHVGSDCVIAGSLSTSSEYGAAFNEAMNAVRESARSVTSRSPIGQCELFALPEAMRFVASGGCASDCEFVLDATDTHK